jgi:hypothetical protein
MSKAWLLGFLLCLLSFPGCTATMPPVRMTVVDARDDRPVAGAFVLFQASASEGTFTGHGGRHVTLFVVEGVSDDSGEFRLPQQEFSTQPFFLNTNYDNPLMVVFKPGYALVILVKTGPTEVKDLSTWHYNNQTVKMKRATTDEETSQAVDLAATYARLSMGGCAWKKIPRFLVAVDRAAADWNRKRDLLADEALRLRTASSPLEFVLMNETLYIEKGCGSPKAFFEPHLR